MAGVILYRTYSPLEYNFFPPCPFYKFTGILCPGCGSQRTIHSLLNGNLAQAFRFNALMVLSIPYLIGGYVLRVVAKHHPKVQPIYRHLYHGKAVYIVLAIVLIFAVGRNIV